MCRTGKSSEGLRGITSLQQDLERIENGTPCIFNLFKF